MKGVAAFKMQILFCIRGFIGTLVSNELLYDKKTLMSKKFYSGARHIQCEGQRIWLIKICQRIC